jgi:uncharacterized protein with FMN-binding domain
MSRSWQGTALFAVIMAGVSVTVAGRMLVGGGGVAAVTPAGSSAQAPSENEGSGDGSSGPSSPSGSAPSSGSSGSSSSSSSSGSSGGSSSSAGSTVTGDTEQTRFGNVQVSVTFSGSKITKVTTLQAPDRGGRDQMLTQYAVPQLEQEVLNSQSARVDTVSGATYTSEGYLASVQSAIDKHK